MSKTQWKTFSIQLNNLTDEQSDEVEERLIKLMEELEDKYDTTGGDFIGIESGEL